MILYFSWRRIQPRFGEFNLGVTVTDGKVGGNQTVVYQTTWALPRRPRIDALSCHKHCTDQPQTHGGPRWRGARDWSETHARPAPSETYAANTRRDSWRESWVSAETHGGDSRRLTRRVTASHAPWVGDDDSACDYTLWYGRYYGGQIRCLQCLAAAIVASIITRFRYILLHCAMIVPWLWHVVPMRAIAWLPPWQS